MGRMKASKSSPFAGFEVYLETLDGERLNEYEITQEDAEKEQDDGRVGAVKRCYLECPDDLSKAFRIVAKLDRPIAFSNPRSTDVEIRYFVDGRRIWDGIYRATAQIFSVCDRLFSIEDGNLMEHQLNFSRATTIEAPERPSQDSKQKKVGEIEITFDFGVSTPTGRRGPPSSIAKPDIGPMNEKIKKGALDRVISGSRGSPSTCIKHYVHFEHRHPDRTPGYTMVFKYHSRQMLMAKDIIARPTPPPGTLDGNEVESPRESPVRGGNEKRIKELEAELDRLRGGGGLKRERDPSSSTGPRAKRRKGNVVGNAIDLTEEDD